MQKSNEASFGCLQNKNPPYDSQGSGNGTEGSHEQKDEVNAHLVAMESNKPFHRVNTTHPSQGYRPFCRQEFWNWPNIYPDIHKLQQSQMNIFENHIYPTNRDHFLPVENRIHYLPYKMFSQGHQHQLQFQDFHYFVVIDFEATCDKERKPHPQEIIEFPSVLVNSVTGQLEASFQTYVRPVYHQLLTDFCKELTGIQQIQVDRGVSLSEALLMHDKWLEDKGIKHKSFAVVTWGNWDCRTMLESECKFKRIRKPPYFNRWINLKALFQEMVSGVRCNLMEAVTRAGLTWEGRPHCGLDDARNTARLLALLMHWGFKFSITNELPPSPPTDCPMAYPPFNNHHHPTDHPTQHHQKLKELPGPIAQFHHPFMDPTGKERFTYCLCGVLSSKCVIRKPGPMQGRCFFGCGNWTASRRAVCNYFVWASP